MTNLLKLTGLTDTLDSDLHKIYIYIQHNVIYISANVKPLRFKILFLTQNCKKDMQRQHAF